MVYLKEFYGAKELIVELNNSKIKRNNQTFTKNANMLFYFSDPFVISEYWDVEKMLHFLLQLYTHA